MMFTSTSESSIQATSPGNSSPSYFTITHSPIVKFSAGSWGWASSSIGECCSVVELVGGVTLVLHFSISLVVSATLTSSAPEAWIQWTLCVWGTAITPSHLASRNGDCWSISFLAMNSTWMFGQIRLASAEYSCGVVIWILSDRICLQTDLLTVSPIPSMTPFPWDMAKKFHLIEMSWSCLKRSTSSPVAPCSGNDLHHSRLDQQRYQFQCGSNFSWPQPHEIQDFYFYAVYFLKSPTKIPKHRNHNILSQFKQRFFFLCCNCHIFGEIDL